MKIFDNDSIFGRLCAKVGVVILVNVQFVFTIIPIVTAGAGFCAMYHCMLRLVRYGEVRFFADFWKSFRQNFKKATLTWLLFLAAIVILAVDLRISIYMTGIWKSFRFAVGGACLALFLIALYIFPVMAAFEGTLRELLKNSIFFIGKNIFSAAIIAGMNAVPLFLTYQFFEWMPLTAFLWCFFGFALVSCINSVFFLKLFEEYLEPVEVPKKERQENCKKTLKEMKRLGI